MKKPKIDMSVTTEVIGLGLVGAGLYMIMPALSFIVIGAFLIWITEKN